MPSIINKTKAKQWVSMERDLIRDKRLKPTPKLIYAVLLSLSQSCENVFPSYLWLAEEIGVDTEVTPKDIDDCQGDKEKATLNKERAVRKFVSSHLQILEDLGMVKTVLNPGRANDYEIYDYYPEQKSTYTLNKKVQGNPEQKSTASYKSIELKEEGEKTPPNLKGDILDRFLECIKIDKSNPLSYSIYKGFMLIAEQHREPYLEYLITVESKKPDFHTRTLKGGDLVKFTSMAYSQWYYKSFNDYRYQQEHHPAQTESYNLPTTVSTIELLDQLTEQEQKAYRGPDTKNKLMAAMQSVQLEKMTTVTPTQVKTPTIETELSNIVIEGEHSLADLLLTKKELFKSA